MKTISGTWNDAPEAVTLIDAHHHLWDLKANYYPFLSDKPEPHFFLGPYEAIRRNYLPADYLRDSQGHNVLTTVHCEAEMDRNRQVAETEWLTAVNARHGFPGAIVAHAWFHTDNAEETLAAQAKFPLVRGIRSEDLASRKILDGKLKEGSLAGFDDEEIAIGYRMAQKLKLKIAISPSGSGQMYPLIMNEAIQQQWAEVGVDVEFQVMDWNALLNFMRQGAKAPEAAAFAAASASLSDFSMSPSASLVWRSAAR